MTHLHSVTAALARLESIAATTADLLPLLLVPASIWAIRVLIDAIDTVAAATQLVYRAGYRSGTMLWPAIHWLINEVNWQQVRGTVIEGLALVCAAIWISARWSHRTLVRVSEQLGRWYAKGIVAPERKKPVAVALVPVAPVAVQSVPVAPVAVKRTKRSKLAQPAPKPSRKRSARNVQSTKPAAV